MMNRTLFLYGTGGKILKTRTGTTVLPLVPLCYLCIHSRALTTLISDRDFKRSTRKIILKKTHHPFSISHRSEVPAQSGSAPPRPKSALGQPLSCLEALRKIPHPASLQVVERIQLLEVVRLWSHFLDT